MGKILLLLLMVPLFAVYGQAESGQNNTVNIQLNQNGGVDYQKYGYRKRNYFYGGSNEINQDYTDEEKNIVDNFYHSGLAQKVQDEECKKNPKACRGQDVDRNMLAETAAKMYGMIIQGALGGKVDIGTKSAKGATAKTGTKATKGADAKSAKAKKNEKPDYCSYAAMGTEMIAMATQKTANQNIMNAPPMSQEDQQKEALYKVKRTHEERAKTTKTQVVGWGVTTGCYTAYLAYGMYSGDMGTTATNILPRLAASAFLTNYFKKVMKEQEDRAKFVQSIIDKLPKTGDCNPVTQRHCFCAEPSSKADPNYVKYCLPEAFQQHLASQAERISCLDNQMREDPSCKCVETKSCYDEKYSKMIHNIPGSKAIASQILPAYKNLSNGQLTEGDLSTAQSLGQKAINTLRKYSKKLNVKPKHLTAKQRAMAKLLSRSMPAALAQELAAAKLPSSVQSKVANFKKGLLAPSSLEGGQYKATNKNRVLTFGGKGLNKASRKKRKSSNNSFANLFKKKKKKSGIRVLRFSERATRRAQITHRKDTPIFDIISHRYRLSGWPIFMD